MIFHQSSNCSWPIRFNFKLSIGEIWYNVDDSHQCLTLKRRQQLNVQVTLTFDNSLIAVIKGHLSKLGVSKQKWVGTDSDWFSIVGMRTNDATTISASATRKRRRNADGRKKRMTHWKWFSTTRIRRCQVARNITGPKWINAPFVPFDPIKILTNSMQPTVEIDRTSVNYQIYYVKGVRHE